MHVTILFDVEDIITPEADDITLRVAQLASRVGVRATFCVVAERARQWQERGRADVVEALARHDVGFHTTWHSVHPTILEGIADKGWEEGVTHVLGTEGAGVQALRDLFGRGPSCYGGPGNTWGPQVNGAMARLGVPAIVYAHSRVPQGDVHRYCGTLCYPEGCSIHDEALHLPQAWEKNLGTLLAEITRRRDRGAQWMELFLGHPSRMLHEEFWDGPNFLAGRNPPRAEWRQPRRKSDADVSLALGNLETTIERVIRMPGVEVRTIAEMNDVFAGARESVLSPDELDQAAKLLDKNIVGMTGWVILPPGLDVTGIREVARQKLDTLRRLTIA